MKVAVVDEARMESPGQVHEHLREALGFPSYYGGNFAALSDCLEDMDHPVRVVVMRTDGGAHAPWCETLCKVLLRCAGHNPFVDVRIVDSRRSADAGMDGREDAMKMLRLELREDATRQELERQMMARLGKDDAEAVSSAVAELRGSGLHFHDVGEVYAAIDGMQVGEGPKGDARAVYRILAEAEAAVHGCAVEETHFHEVGDADAVANVMAICLAFERLGRPEVEATPVQTGRGKVRCAHGILDIPAPATKAILDRGIPVCRQTREGEWCTPTSAAIILHFANRFVS